MVFNPEKQFDYCMFKERCFTGDAPTLSRLRIAYGEETAKSWLEIQIRDLSEYAGCKDKLLLSQIQEISKVIILNFYFLKVTELMYFFQLFKAGQFGRFYGAVDGLVITEALQLFLKFRKTELEHIDKRNEDARKQNEKNEWAKTAISYADYEKLYKNKKQL